MMLVELKPLFSRLNPYCTNALESAAGMTLSNTHYEIAIEHLLRQLLDDPQSDLPLILRHFDVDSARFSVELDNALTQLKNGNPGRPVFSLLLTECIQNAWLVTSITLGQQSIRSGSLLISLLNRLSSFGSDLPWVRTLRTIKSDQLVDEFNDICATSIETEQESSETGTTHTQSVQSQDQQAIGKFCEDFTAKARDGKIDPVFGRDQEIRQMIDILARRRKNNPICVGEPGVGKTAVVEGLALRIIHEDVPEFLLNTRLIGLDIGLLEAGASVKGEFERRLRAVIDEIRASTQPIILFIDEAHMLIGAGGQSGGTDAANLLKPALARGELRTIAATTWSEYKKYFEKDPALARRFQVVRLDEPDVATTIQILRGLKQQYENSHGVVIRDDAIVAAAQLSARYITGRLLPDKAVDLLDTAAARVRIAISNKPAVVEAKERAIQGLEREQKALQREEDYAPGKHGERLNEIQQEIEQLHVECDALRAQWQTQQDAIKQLIELRQRIDQSPEDTHAQFELQQTRLALEELQGEEPMIFVETDPDAIARVVSDWTGVPLGKMQRDAVGSILSLADQLKTRVHGQAHAIDKIASVLKAAHSGLRDPRQPVGIFLLVGPSGVGKTETALAVADQLFGGEQSLITINMSEFQEKHTVSRLIGAPAGYVGYGEGGDLTEAVRRRPYSVVLLDEVEKAHPDVLNLFYQVFDKGVLADGEGRIIDFSNTVVFLTSNLATDEITALTHQVRPDPDVVDEKIRPALMQFFKPALLARMTVIPYYTLQTDQLIHIVALKLNRLSERLASSSRISLTFTDAVKRTLAERCSSVDSGARNIDLILSRSLTPRLSDLVLQAMAQSRPLKSIEVDVDQAGQWVIDVSYDDREPTSEESPS